MNDRQKEFNHLVFRQMELRHQLEHIEKRLDVFEQIHLQALKYGRDGLLSIKNEDIEDYLNGGYDRSLDTYKKIYKELFMIERRICEITNNHRDFY